MIENFRISTQVFEAMDTHEQAAAIRTLPLEDRRMLLRVLGTRRCRGRDSVLR